MAYASGIRVVNLTYELVFGEAARTQAGRRRENIFGYKSKEKTFLFLNLSSSRLACILYV
jgi:hypothetical protein